MKRLLFVLPFLLMGCVTSNYSFKSYSPGDVKTVTVGSPLITVEAGVKNDIYNTVKEGIRRELIYTGMENGILTVQYREYYINYSGVFVKDALTQNLKYDLGRSKIVKYENLSLEIMSTDNNEITFKVLDGGTNKQEEVSQKGTTTSNK